MTYTKKPYAGISSADYYSYETRCKKFDVREAGCAVNGSTDDTTNFIATITEADAEGGGDIIIPDTGYAMVIGGALDANGFQVSIPQRNYDDQARRAFRIIGEGVPNCTQSAGIGGATPPTKGPRILSTLISGTSNSYVIGSRGAAGNYQQFNYNDCSIENLTILVTPDSNSKVTIGGIGFEKAANAIVKNVNVFPFNLNLVNSAAPLNNAVGIAMPMKSNDFFNVLENCSVGGFKSGFRLGEHQIMYNLFAGCCTYGYEFTATIIPVRAEKIEANWCINALYFSGIAYVNIGNMSNEIITDGVKWYNYAQTILDASNYGHGKVYYNITGPTQDNTNFSKSGGTGLQCLPTILANAAAFTVTGKRNDATALTDLLTKLVAQGLIIDGTTAS